VILYEVAIGALFELVLQGSPENLDGLLSNATAEDFITRLGGACLNE